MESSVFSSPLAVPILAAIASDVDVLPDRLSPFRGIGDPEVVTGRPMYDLVGTLYHKRHLLWRKKMIAIQGPYLLYFVNANPDQLTESNLRHVIDLGCEGMALTVHHAGQTVVALQASEGGGGVGRQEWRDQTLTFELTGPDLPEGDMLFKAQTVDECARWCHALRVAMNGRCERCVVQPAKSPQHKYCVECTKQRKKEKEDERNQQAIQRLTQLMSRQLSTDAEGNLGDEEDAPRLTSSLARVMPAIHYSSQLSIGQSGTAVVTSPSNSISPTATSVTSMTTPQPRAGRLAPILPPLHRSASLSSLLSRPASAVFSDDISGGLSSGVNSPLPSSGSNISILSCCSGLRRAGGRIPGLLPTDLDRLPQSNQASTPDSPLDCEPQFCLGCSSSSSAQATLVTKLPGCGHQFHTNCVREWLLRQATCPKCGVEVYLSEF